MMEYAYFYASDFQPTEEEIREAFEKLNGNKDERAVIVIDMASPKEEEEDDD